MAESARRDNIIWIFGDQHRAQALGFAGDPNVFTPNLDRLATEGLRPSGIGGSPLCCPYRGSLLTSRYPHECVPGHQDPLPIGMPTIAVPLRESGYDTAWFGKWHVGGFDEADGRAAFATVAPELRGDFQTWIGYENNNSQYDSWVHGHRADGSEVEHYRLPGYETDALTDLLIDYIEEHRCPEGESRPFFASLSVQPPHDPYTAPERFMAAHNAGGVRFRANVPDVEAIRRRAGRELAGYYAMIENLDWNIGRIRESLSAAGLTENTHIVFFSDHGDMHGSQGLFKKTNPYEESIRVPMIIAGTDPAYGGNRGPVDILMNHVDVAPTSLGLARVPVPNWMRGTDYSAVRRTRTKPDTPAVEYPDSAYLQLVRPTGHPDSTDRPWRGVVTRDGWKYICLENQPWLMFDLNTDPYEQVNLAHNTRYRTERGRLHARLESWITETGDSFPLPHV